MATNKPKETSAAPTLPVQSDPKIAWEFIIMSIIFLILTIYTLHQEGKINIIKKDFSKRNYLINFIIIILFSILCIYLSRTNPEQYHGIGDAAEKGLIAFIIAYMGRIDVTVAPFWFVWILAYFLQM